MEKQTQDILHHIELKENSMFDYICLGLAIKEIRKKRRHAKDRKKILTPIAGWIASNQGVINNMQQVLGKVRKEERTTQQRFYVDRTDIIGKILGNRDGGEVEPYD